jgi:hypothetical protein
MVYKVFLKYVARGVTAFHFEKVASLGCSMVGKRTNLRQCIKDFLAEISLSKDPSHLPLNKVTFLKIYFLSHPISYDFQKNIVVFIDLIPVP